MVEAITNETFDNLVTKSPVPVLVDFWAPWCGPCKMLSPLVDEVAEEKAEGLQVYKVNVDNEEELATKFGVVSIPTLILFSNGKIVKQQTGFMTKDSLLKFVSEVV